MNHQSQKARKKQNQMSFQGNDQTLSNEEALVTYFLPFKIWVTKIKKMENLQKMS